MAKRRCTAKTKRGTRCSRPPMEGGDLCIAHANRKEKDARGFGGPQAGSGRPRNPRVIDVMRERVEDEVDDILQPYFEQLREAVIVVKYQGEAVVTDVPDTGARIEAAERLLDRAFGRPVLRTEITGPQGAPVRLEQEFADPKIREALHDLVDRVGAARASQPRRRSARD